MHLAAVQGLLQEWSLSSTAVVAAWVRTPQLTAVYRSGKRLLSRNVYQNPAGRKGTSMLSNMVVIQQGWGIILS